MTLLASSEKDSIQERPYQVRAWKNMGDFTKQRLRQTLGNPKNIDLWTTMTINMTTGSGKTFTAGEFLRRLYLIRNKLERITKSEIPIRILVINDRINLVDQLKTDLIDGRDGKPPLLGKNIKEHAIIKLFHSAADSTGAIKVKDEIAVSGTGKDAVYFSTFGSTDKFADEDIAWDIIVVDEGHHLKAGTYKASLKNEIQRSEKKNGRTPLVIPMTGTLDPISDIVNDPVVNYPLAEYIASPYSPDIEYNLVTSADFTSEMLKGVYNQIQKIGELKDFREKKKQIEEMRIYIEEHLAKFGGLTELVSDIITRLNSLDHTIIFASSIEEVDEITKEINKQAGADTAIALHSKIDEADQDVLDAYRDGKRKIIVAVDKLNEGIDLPATKNVVFWRDVKSPTVFQQQFGRGMRGDKVRFFDYTGVLRNMAWVQGVNQEILDLPEELIDKDPSIETEEAGERPRRGITMLFGNVRKKPISSEVSLEEIILQMQKLEEESMLSREEIKQSFDDLGGYDALMKYKQEELQQLNFRGHKMRSLATQYGFKSKHGLVPNIQIGFREFISRMYDKEFVYDPEGLTPEKIKQYLDGLGGYNVLINYKKHEVRAMKINENKLSAIVAGYGFASKYGLDILNSRGFKEFISYVYGKEFTYEKLVKEDIKPVLDKLGGYEVLMQYKQLDLQSIDIKKNKIGRIATVYGFKSIHGTEAPDELWFQEFISFVYGREFTYVPRFDNKLKKEDIKKQFDLWGGYDALMNYSVEEIKAMDIGGNKILAISTICGFTGNGKTSMQTATGFQQFLSFLYQNDFKHD